MVNFDPPPKFSLPPQINIYGTNPFGSGVWIGGGTVSQQCSNLNPSALSLHRHLRSLQPST